MADSFTTDIEGRVTAIGHAADSHDAPIETVGERGEILAEFINASTEELCFLRACLVQQRAYEAREAQARAFTLATHAFQLASARTDEARNKCLR